MGENIQQIIKDVEKNKKLLANLAATYARELARAKHPYVDEKWANWKDEDPIVLYNTNLDSIKIHIYYGTLLFQTQLDELQEFLDSQNKQEFVEKVVEKGKRNIIERRIFDLETWLKSNPEDEYAKDRLYKLSEHLKKKFSKKW